MQRPPSLATLAIELLDLIIHDLDEPKDLLHLALSSKVFHGLIIPIDLELRHIRCDPRRDDLWNKLIETPALAAKVRFLELVYGLHPWNGFFQLHLWNGPMHPMDIIPPFLDLPPMTLDLILTTVNPSFIIHPSFEPLARAIKLMSSLSRFSWLGIKFEGDDLARIFASLDASSSPLQELQIGYSHTISLSFDEDHHFSKPLPLPTNRLPTIKKLSLANPCTDDHSCSSLHLFEMLVTEPGLLLTDLLLDLAGWDIWREGYSDFDNFFRIAFLQNLEKFTIFRAIPHPIRKDLTEFLNRHSKLIAVWLGEVGPPEFDILKLPNLEALQYIRSPLVDHPPLTIPQDISNRLKHLGMSIDDKSLSLFDETTLLESCYLEDVMSISEFVNKVPHLRRLDYRPLMPSTVRGDELKDITDSRLEDLSKLTKLTHLGGFFVDRRLTIQDPHVEDSLKTLVNRLPDLKYVELCYDEKGVWATIERGVWTTIERDKNGNYSGFQETKVPVHILRQWGTFFFGYY